MSDEATRIQSKPTGNGKLVVVEVVKDLLNRSDEGAKKYGTPLRVDNGRSALLDLYQELLDATQYIKQELMERTSRASSIGGLPTLELVGIANLIADSILADPDATVGAKTTAQSVRDNVPKTSQTVLYGVLGQAVAEINNRITVPS